MQSAAPLAVLGALHFEAITDLAWSCDGSLLAIASYDGYCRYAACYMALLQMMFSQPFAATALSCGVHARTLHSHLYDFVTKATNTMHVLKPAILSVTEYGCFCGCCSQN